MNAPKPHKLPVLPQCASAAVVEAWTDDAVERLFSMRETCDLDIGDTRVKHGPRPVGRYLGVTKERVRQETKAAVAHVKAELIARGIDDA